MTDFKPGDRVQYNAKDTHATRPHNDIGTVTEVDEYGVKTRWDNGDRRYNARSYLVPVAPKVTPNPRPLVGPAPTPPATPRYVAPFRAVGTLIYDATHRVVLEANFILRETADVTEFATYVATALNASVFTED